MSKKIDLEEGLDFQPAYDANGLIPCITQCAETGRVLMMAYMNDEALCKTLESGEAHYWSRSRKMLWHKGATSGFVQKVVELRTDCDQDCLLLFVEVRKPKGHEDAEGTCHTGRHSCFYRKVSLPMKEGRPAALVFSEED
ncbi:MAG: phosphoribosyl-AMP cyclohydrolase [Alphaproteobacteria bacterium]|jgi:phosphoribosyl-AMP cyclohydrolase|nr:phosphoribosyl-AMP cyclohydrolase [Alphaproteobacteria bacterium]QQS56233.1 MAG: phosphoribosyl-AMP cyclohydrolase [Alphaproteobacteria bacterium]